MSLREHSVEVSKEELAEELKKYPLARKLTLDWDNCSPDKAEKRLKVIKIAFPNRMIYFRESSSGDGYHVIVFPFYASYDKILNLRRWLGDDLLRITCDAHFGKIYGSESDVFFSNKEGKTVGSWKKYI